MKEADIEIHEVASMAVNICEALQKGTRGPLQAMAALDCAYALLLAGASKMMSEEMFIKFKEDAKFQHEKLSVFGDNAHAEWALHLLATGANAFPHL